MHATKVLEDLAVSNPPLCVVVRNWWTLRSSVNQQIIHQLDEIVRFPGYSGKRGVGVRKGTVQQGGTDASNDTGWDPMVSEALDETEADLEHAHDLERLTDFIQRITD